MKRAINITIACSLLAFALLWQVIFPGGPGSACSPVLPGVFLFAQEPGEQPLVVPPATERMPESTAVLYQVMGVILVVWAGLAIFLYMINRRVTRLEKQMPERPGDGS